MSRKMTIRPKSPFQKDECIVCSTEPATQEVVYGLSMIRCCTNDHCVAMAKVIAGCIDPKDETDDTPVEVPKAPKNGYTLVPDDD